MPFPPFQCPAPNPAYSNSSTALSSARVIPGSASPCPASSTMISFDFGSSLCSRRFMCSSSAVLAQPPGAAAFRAHGCAVRRVGRQQPQVVPAVRTAGVLEHRRRHLPEARPLYAIPDDEGNTTQIRQSREPRQGVAADVASDDRVHEQTDHQQRAGHPTNQRSAFPGLDPDAFLLRDCPQDVGFDHARLMQHVDRNRVKLRHPAPAGVPDMPGPLGSRFFFLSHCPDLRRPEYRPVARRNRIRGRRLRRSREPSAGRECRSRSAGNAGARA